MGFTPLERPALPWWLGTSTLADRITAHLDTMRIVADPSSSPIGNVIPQYRFLARWGRSMLRRHFEDNHRRSRPFQAALFGCVTHALMCHHSPVRCSRRDPLVMPIGETGIEVGLDGNCAALDVP